MGFDKEIKLGDTFQELPKSKFQVQHADNIGHFPFYTSGDSVLTHSEFNVDDEIIFLATGGKANVKFHSGKAAYSTDTYAIKGKDHSSKYLFYLLLNNLSFIDRNFFSGSGLKHLQKKDFRNWLLNFPDDTNEEESIVQFLSTLDRAIASTEQLIAKYQRIKTGLLHDLLTRGIDENGNLRSEKTHQFKDSKLGRIPVEWECKPLGEEIFAIDPQPDHRTPALVQNGIPYLGINDIDENGNIDLKSCRKVGRNVLDKQMAAFTINKGDIIFGKIGTIGQPKVLPTFKNNYTLSANVILIQPKATPEFIYWLLVSEIINRQISNTVHTTSQPAYGMEKIRNLSIIFPKEDERKVISEILQKQECSITKFQQNLTKLQSLKTGLMQDLLSGKVRMK